MMGLKLQETCCSSQALSHEDLTKKQVKKSCSLNLDSNLDRSSTQAVFVETYEIRTSRSDFRPMFVYLYRISFLITLDIYKAYFKGRRACRK